MKKAPKVRVPTEAELKEFRACTAQRTAFIRNVIDFGVYIVDRLGHVTDSTAGTPRPIRKVRNFGGFTFSAFITHMKTGPNTLVVERSLSGSVLFEAEWRGLKHMRLDKIEMDDKDRRWQVELLEVISNKEQIELEYIEANRPAMKKCCGMFT